NVVAEGIETDFEADMLCEYGADYGQGFLYSRPVDEESFLALLT
ncbi:MAG: EAL domain-containing protein, partial [Proteobacteria bacterium]|nr:EAL domain-containing protein [Pseudomonadota bacterium]